MKCLSCMSVTSYTDVTDVNYCLFKPKYNDVAIDRLSDNQMTSGPGHMASALKRCQVRVTVKLRYNVLLGTTEFGVIAEVRYNHHNMLCTIHEAVRSSTTSNLSEL